MEKEYAVADQWIMWFSADIKPFMTINVLECGHVVETSPLFWFGTPPTSHTPIPRSKKNDWIRPWNVFIILTDISILQLTCTKKSSKRSFT